MFDGTHQDAEQGSTRSCVFWNADVVQWFAEDGPVIILIDQLNEHACEAHVVGHGLVGIKLRKDGEPYISNTT